MVSVYHTALIENNGNIQCNTKMSNELFCFHSVSVSPVSPQFLRLLLHLFNVQAVLAFARGCFIRKFFFLLLLLNQFRFQLFLHLYTGHCNFFKSGNDYNV